MTTWCLGGEAGKSGWKPVIFIGGPLLPVGRNCKFSFHFFLCRLGYFSKMGKLHFGFHPHYCFPSFSFTWKELLANCTQVPLVGGSHPGERHIQASRSTTRASKGSASIRTSLKQIRVHHIDPADALETSGFPCLRLCNLRQAWSRRRSNRWEDWGCGLPFFGKNGRLGLPFPSAIRSTDEHVPCLHFRRKCGFCLFRKTGFLLSSWSILCSVPIVANNKDYNYILHLIAI